MTQLRLDDGEYEELLTFRTGLRRFLRWSNEQAASAGLTGQQHQLLLAVRGHDGTVQPTIGDVAEHLLLRHHSAVELVDRAEQAGLVERVVDGDDRRIVRLDLTDKGRGILDRLTAAHVEELARLAPVIARLADGLGAAPRLTSGYRDRSAGDAP
jgi:DNA-binding MarR family transcriptional regulator